MHELGGLENLDTLYLRGYRQDPRGASYRFPATPVGTLPRLPSLSFLEATVTSAPAFLRTIGRGVPALVRARIYSPEFSGMSPGVFSGMQSLEVLGLYRASREPGSMMLPNRVFARLTSLRFLGLSADRYSADDTLILGSDTFVGLESLEGLTLWGLNADLPPHVFSPLRSLRSLRWYGVDEANVRLPEGVFADMPQLESLVLNSTGPASLPAGVFDGMHQLKGLSLRSNQLTSLRPGMFRDLSQLIALDLSNNPLGGLPPGLFVGITRLHRLELRERTYSEPFPISLQLVRTDTTDLGAPGPATVVVRVREGAPLDIVVDLHAPGATLLSSTVLIAAGASASAPIMISRADGATGSVTLTFGDPPAVQSQEMCRYWGSLSSLALERAPCYGGIFVDAGSPITLFR